MATTSYICQGIKVADQNVDHITVEVYLDQALTNIVSSKTSTATWDGSQYTVQDTPLVFTGLTAGTTYYMRAGAVAKASGAVTWSATYSTSSGVITVPTTTFSGTFTATVSGVTYDVTPASAPTTVDHYEAYWVKDGSTPLSNVHPMWSGSVDSSGNFTFFAGGKAGDSISAYVRTIGVGPGEVQSWEPLGGAIAVATEYTGTITGTFTGAVDSTATIDGVSAGSVVTSSITGTNVNLCPDSAFKFGATTYWPNNINATYTAMGILNGVGANGGNALVYTLNGSNPPTQIGQGSFPISVTSQVYTLSGSVSVPSGCTVSNAEWHLLRADTLAELGNTPTQYSGTSGRSQAQISIPAGVSTVIIVPHWYGSGPSGEQVLFSCPQLEAGSVMTSYKDSLIDNQTGGLASTVPIQLPSGTLSPVGIGDAHDRLVDAIPTKGTIHNTLIVSGSGTAVSTIDTSAVTGTQRNLVPDSGIKCGAAFWTLNGCTVVQGAGWAGGNAFKLAYNGAYALSGKMPVVAGQSYVLSCAVDLSPLAGSSTVIYSQVTYYNSSGTALQQSYVGWSLTGSPLGQYSNISAGNMQLGSVYQNRIWFSSTAPANSAYAVVLSPQAGPNATSGYSLWSAFQFEAGLTMTAYRESLLDDQTGGLPSGMPVQEDTGSLSTVNLGLQHRFNRLAIPGANQLTGTNTITGITRTQIELQELHDRASNLLYSQTEFDGRNNIFNVTEGAEPLAEVHDRAIGNLYDHTHLMGSSGVSGTGKTALILSDLHDRVSATINGSTGTGLANVPDDATSKRYAVLAVDTNRRALIDFTQSGHLGQSLKNIPDDAFSERFAVLAIDTNRRPIIDGASSHVNWTQDHLPDGTSRFAVVNGANLKAVSAVDGSNMALINGASAHTNWTQDYLPDGTTFKRLAHVASDNTLHASTAMKPQGSTVPVFFSGSVNFSLLNSTTLQNNWVTGYVYWPDGSNYGPINNGNPQYTTWAGYAVGYPPTPTSGVFYNYYYCNVVFNPNTNTVLVQEYCFDYNNIAHGYTDLNAFKAAAYADGCVPLLLASSVTLQTASVGGNTSGSDSGTGGCPVVTQLIETRECGHIPAGHVVIGQHLRDPEDKWNIVTNVSYTTETAIRLGFDVGDEIEVNQRHLMRTLDGTWISAEDAVIGQEFDAGNGVSIRLTTKQGIGFKDIALLTCENHRYMLGVVGHNVSYI